MSSDPGRALRERYVKRLVATSHLRSEPWIEAFKEVPRHVFVPRIFRRHPTGGYEAADSSDPGWLEMVYSDTVLTTQLDGDERQWTQALAAPVAGTPTSSSSQPSLMAQMLEALDVHDGHQVLEIGTGTGYQAALLSHRLDPDQVTSVDVDPQLCTHAEVALHQCGYRPAIACRDGIEGHPAGAPYDRIIATCSVAAVPAAWIDQTRLGGLLLTSLYRPLGGGPLVRLTITGGGMAQGQFQPGGGGFMPTRNEPTPEAMPLFKAALYAEADRGPRPTIVGGQALEHPDFGMLAALRLPGVTSLGFTPDTGAGPQQWLLADDGSWACIEETTGTVSQHGNRSLWDEVEHVHQQWTQLGAPTRDRLGLTVSSTGEHQFWLDDPQQAWWTAG